MGVNKVEYGSSTLVDLTGDTVTPETLLQGETAHNAAGNRITGTARPGVQTFNGRSGSVLPIAGDYSADQVNYDSNKTVKQVIDALTTKEASDIAGQQSLLKDTVGWTGKNLLKNTATSQTVRGVTFTVNADGSVTANGTATGGNASLSNWGITLTLPAGKYIFSGCPSGGGANTYALLMQDDPYTQNIFDYGDGVVIDISETKTFHPYFGYVREGVTVSNLTFYPMLRKADITDPTYEPYHESVEVMYEEEIHGVNLLKNQGFSRTFNGLTYVYNTDGSVTVNGTATANSYVQIKTLVDTNPISIEGIPVILSGAPAGSGVNKYWLYAKYRNADNTAYEKTYEEYGNGIEFTIPSGRKWEVYIAILKDQTVNNLVFKPMLRKADIEDSTYRPYNHQAIQNQLNAQGVLGAKNLLKITANTQTNNGVTFTVNRDSDGNVIDVTVNGTASANTSFVLRTKTPLAAGKSYIMSRGEAGDNNFQMVATAWNSGSYVKNIIDVGAGGYTEKSFVADYNGYNDIQISIFVRSGKTISNAKVYPMLRLASDPDDTYQPYAMTNRELTEELTVKQSKISTSLSATLNVLRKYGKVVTFSFRSTNTTGSADNEIGIIPDGFRPANDCIILAGITDGASKRITITPNSGKVAFADAVSDTTLTIHATWITL